jgi:hypothetical protein
VVVVSFNKNNIVFGGVLVLFATFVACGSADDEQELFGSATDGSGAAGSPDPRNEQGSDDAGLADDAPVSQPTRVETAPDDADAGAKKDADKPTKPEPRDDEAED